MDTRLFFELPKGQSSCVLRSILFQLLLPIYNNDSWKEGRLGIAFRLSNPVVHAFSLNWVLKSLLEILLKTLLILNYWFRFDSLSQQSFQFVKLETKLADTPKKLKQFKSIIGKKGRINISLATTKQRRSSKQRRKQLFSHFVVPASSRLRRHKILNLFMNMVPNLSPL